VVKVFSGANLKDTIEPIYRCKVVFQSGADAVEKLQAGGELVQILFWLDLSGSRID